ncbi:recombinase family protein [Glycomyces sp. MUSA5-2]|uniref:recombinase family protein n=1 Tax=Glycomyces sp. MUSA5-2 TaxID=2053002 RepID=UPI00300B37EF
MKTVTMIGYLRRSKVNKKHPEITAHGIEAQRAAILREARYRGWRLIWAPVDDGRTGANVNRPGIAWALAELKAGRADGLVVAKLDRLSRSVADFGTIVKRSRDEGWSIALLDLGVDTSTPNGKLVAGIIVQIAEWERDIIAERTKDGLEAAREAGKTLGRPRSISDHTTARILGLRRSGSTYRAIADALNHEGVPTAHGGKMWRSSTIRGVILRGERQSGDS